MWRRLSLPVTRSRAPASSGCRSEQGTASRELCKRDLAGSRRPIAPFAQRGASPVGVALAPSAELARGRGCKTSVGLQGSLGGPFRIFGRSSGVPDFHCLTVSLSHCLLSQPKKSRRNNRLWIA